jgi:plasmid stabilization system protein ParE
MTLPVVFRRRFRNDLAAGYDWYEAQRPGLGEDFLSAVQSTVRNIESYSEIFAAVHGDVRRVIIPKFPFAIFYVVEPTRVVALRLLHTARDPKLWPQSRT